MIFILGARGRLGSAIAAQYPHTSVVALRRPIYTGWSDPGADESVTRYFGQQAAEGSTIFVASGLLDPRLPAAEIMRVNFQLPKNIIDGVSQLGIKVVTFGTVMEELLSSQNPYVRSKTALSTYVAEMGSTETSPLHIRIHTLYGGGEPSSFMFLGQMLDALRRGAPFVMTSGAQLREYHHVADDAKAISRVAEGAAPGVMNLSHGQPLRLKDIAEAVLTSLEAKDRLRIGGRDEPFEENYTRIFQRPDALKDAHFRDSLPGVVQYMRSCFELTAVKVGGKSDGA